MKFFIPAAEDAKQAESVYSSIKKFAKKNTGWDVKPDRIYSIKYKHDGKEYYAKVGEHETLTKDLVFAILLSNTYLVCTTIRGALKGEPILVGINEVIDIEYFE